MSAALEQAPLQVRPMCQADLPLVAEIEQDSYDFPWSLGIFRDCLLAGYFSVVLEIDGEVNGYAIMTIAAGDAHLLNICISPENRRRGLGRRLLQFMLDRAAAENADTIYLEVRPTNKAALTLYADTDFVELGRRRDYYRAHDGREDAVILVRRSGLMC